MGKLRRREVSDLLGSHTCYVKGGLEVIWGACLPIGTHGACGWHSHKWLGRSQEHSGGSRPGSAPKHFSPGLGPQFPCLSQEGRCIIKSFEFYSHHSQAGYSTVESTIGPLSGMQGNSADPAGQLKARYTGPAATPATGQTWPPLRPPPPYPTFSQRSKDFGRLKLKYYGFSLTAHYHLGRNLCLSMNGSIFLYPSPEPFHPPDYEFPNQEVRFFTSHVLEIAVRCVTRMKQSHFHLRLC